MTSLVYEIIAIEVWGGAQPNLGEGVAVDGRDGTVRKRVDDFL